jgi:HPt (histidine-containing phosphotransfer) domain-containing protein
MPFSQKKPFALSLEKSQPSLDEIQNRLQRRFLDRLALRIKKMRRLLMERDWPGIKAESLSLSRSSEQFGFAHLAQRCTQVAQSIPDGKIAKVATLDSSKKLTFHLVQEIDQILIENTVMRP